MSSVGTTAQEAIGGGVDREVVEGDEGEVEEQDEQTYFRMPKGPLTYPSYMKGCEPLISGSRITLRISLEQPIHGVWL